MLIRLDRLIQRTHTGVVLKSVSRSKIGSMKYHPGQVNRNENYYSKLQIANRDPDKGK